MFLLRSSMAPVDFQGLRIFDYTADQSLSSSLAVIEVAPGAQHAEAYSRRSDKYYLVTSGEIRFIIDGGAQQLRTGDFCFVERGQRFSYSNQSAEMATLVLVHTPSFALRDEIFVGG